MDIELGNTKFLVTIPKLFTPVSKDSEQVVHSHVGFELHVMNDGDAVLETGQGSIRLRKGEALIVPPGFIHENISLQNGIVTCFTFTLEKSGAEEKEEEYSYIKSVLSLVTKPRIIAAGNRYYEYLERIFFEYYSKRYFSRERILSFFRLLITDIIFDLASFHGMAAEKEWGIQANSYMLVGAVMEEYVITRLKSSPSLKELSRIVHLGVRQTSRVFSQCFGISFSEYIKRRRLDSAKYLLAYTDKSFGTIAVECGYHSYNGFYKIFKKSLGISPEEYRKKSRGKEE